MTSTHAYVCRIGFNRVDGGTDLRFEPGEDVAGVSATVLERLAEDGVVERVASTKRPAKRKGGGKSGGAK